MSDVKTDLETADKNVVGTSLAQVDSNGKGEAVATTARVQDHPAERALCWKFDIRILPVLAIMCMLPLLHEHLGD